MKKFYLLILALLSSSYSYSAGMIASPVSTESIGSYPTYDAYVWKAYFVYDPSTPTWITDNCGGTSAKCQLGASATYTVKNKATGLIFETSSNLKNGDSVSVYGPINSENDMIAALKDWQSKFGNKIVSSQGGYNPSTSELLSATICFATELEDGANRRIMPGSCRNAPPPLTQCDTTTPNVTLDHGNLTLGNINGNRISTRFNINCNQNASVRFDIVPAGAIELKPGLTSTISVAGRNLGELVSLTSGSNSLEISSVLSDTGTTAGAFEKTVVLVQSFN